METIALLFKVLWAPREALHAAAQRPRIIAPLLLLTLFAALETAVVFFTLDPGVLRLQQFEREGYADKISESDKAIHAQTARNNVTFAATVTTIRTLVIVFAVAGIFFLFLGAGRGASFRSFLSVTAFAFIPTIFHSIAIMGTVLAFEPTPETLQRAGSIGPVLLVDPPLVPSGFYFALGMLDAISIWILALLAIGYGFALKDRVRPAFCAGAVAAVYCVWTGAYVVIRLALA